MNATYDDASIETVSLSQGTIAYRDVGSESGDVVLFVHGVLVNGDLWRDVVSGLLERSTVRCLVPTLPLGGHTRSMSGDSDLTLPGLAHLLCDFLDALGIERVVLIGNDTGGAICQVFLARYPERVSRLVLTNCDAFENFLPTLLRPLQYGARIPGFTTLLAGSLRLRPISRFVVASVAETPVARAERDAFFEGVIGDRGVRRDLREFLRSVSSRYTTEAAAAFPEFDRPVWLVWSSDDPLFPIAHAERLVSLFPNARLERIDGSRALVPIDRPEKLAKSIAEFVETTVPT